MNIIGHLSAAAIAYSSLTDAQATRLAALGETRPEPRGEPTRFWDDNLLDRLTQPLSRIRE